MCESAFCCRKISRPAPPTTLWLDDLGAQQNDGTAHVLASNHPECLKLRTPPHHETHEAYHSYESTGMEQQRSRRCRHYSRE